MFGLKLQIDDEIERHMDLLREIQDNPLDINAVVARRRKDFTGEFFYQLTALSDTYDSLEDRDCKKVKFFSMSILLKSLNKTVSQTPKVYSYLSS